MIKGGNKAVDVRPPQGGRLMLGAALDGVGLANYSEKLDFRRFLDREVRSEGHDVFAPAPEVDVQQQCVVSKDDVLLTFEARLPSGVRSYIAATATTIYALDTIDGEYFHTDATYFDSEYFAQHQSEWRVVGTGFSPDTTHWQASLVNGYVGLNNAIDLPVTYRAGDESVVPIYELREIGVASVAYMTDFSGYMMCLGIRQISEEDLETLMTPIAGTFSQTGATISLNRAEVSVSAGTVTASLTGAFNDGHVGKKIRFPNGYSGTIASHSTNSCVITGGDTAYNASMPFRLPFVISGTASSYTMTATFDAGVEFTSDMVGREIWVGARKRTIVSVDSPTQVTVDFDGPVSDAGIIMPDTYGRWTGAVSDYSYRVLWSNPASPRSYSASGVASIESGSSTLMVPRPLKSITSGSQIIVEGAGVDGGVLIATVLRAMRGGTELQLKDPAPTGAEDVVFMLNESYGGVSDAFDIQDDGSPIIAALKNKASLIIYRETSIFTCVATGRPDAPFSFRLEYGGSLPDDRSLCLRYPATLIAVGDSNHLYCGANDICTFDANTRRPTVIDSLRYSSKPVFAAIEAGERVFSCNNEMTSEIWISVPSRSLVLRVDYRTQGFTASTTPISITSGNSMERPPVTDVPTERWFVMALGGILAVYGKTDAKDVVASYKAVQSGLACSAGGPVFQPYHVGRSIVFDSGEVSLITEYESPTSVKVAPDREVTESDFRIVSQNWARFRCGYISRLRSGMNAFTTGRDASRITGYGVVLHDSAKPFAGATRTKEVALTNVLADIPVWLGLDGDAAVAITGMTSPDDFTFSNGFITFKQNQASVTVSCTIADLAPSLKISIATKTKLNEPKTVKVNKQFSLDSQWMPSQILGRYIEDAIEISGASASAELAARTYEVATARAGGIGAVTHGV